MISIVKYARSAFFFSFIIMRCALSPDLRERELQYNQEMCDQEKILYPDCAQKVGQVDDHRDFVVCLALDLVLIEQTSLVMTVHVNDLNISHQKEEARKTQRRIVRLKPLQVR